MRLAIGVGSKISQPNPGLVELELLSVLLQHSRAASQDSFVLQRVKKDVDKGTQHSDMFLLKPEEGGEGTAVP